MRHRSLKLFVCWALSLTLTACGGAGGPSTTINVSFTDFKFIPSEFTVPAGQTITITAANDGAVVHELVIMNLGPIVGDKFGDEDEPNIFWEVEVDPGGSRTETFAAPAEPGEYQLVCGIPGHMEAGMIGKLVVVK